MKLTFIGNDNWDRPTFEVGNTGTYVKDINLGKKSMCLYWSYPKNDPNGEPNYAFYAEGDIELIGYQYISAEQEANYALLFRSMNDCIYYLGNGNRTTMFLYETNEKAHIEEMKRLYHLFPDDQKPDFITIEDIEEFERQMCEDQ